MAIAQHVTLTESLAPIVVIAYNRPIHLRNLLQCLKSAGVTGFYLSLEELPSTDEGVAIRRQISEIVRAIDWATVSKVDRPNERLGLRRSVETAVTSVLKHHDRVIVLEDDILLSRHALDFVSKALEHFRGSRSIAHVSAYNLVPVDVLARPNFACRRSAYVHSLAWGTWHDKWTLEPELTRDWRSTLSLKDLRMITGSRAAAFNWSRSFDAVAKGEVDSWAVPWLFRLWSTGNHALSPNRNLVAYNGWHTGTHDTPRWMEIPLGEPPPYWESQPLWDRVADQWETAHAFDFSLWPTGSRYLHAATTRMIDLFTPKAGHESNSKSVK